MFSTKRGTKIIDNRMLCAFFFVVHFSPLVTFTHAGLVEIWCVFSLLHISFRTKTNPPPPPPLHTHSGTALVNQVCTLLARMQVFRSGGSMKGGRRRQCPSSGVRGILLRKILKFQVLGNAVSAILRQSQCVLISQF